MHVGGARDPILANTNGATDLSLRSPHQHLQNIGCSVARLLDCLVDWLLTIGLLDYLFGLVAYMIDCLVDYLVACLVGCLPGWLLGRLLAWLFAWLLA